MENVLGWTMLFLWPVLGRSILPRYKLYIVILSILFNHLCHLSYYLLLLSENKKTKYLYVGSSILEREREITWFDMNSTSVFYVAWII